jgi:hypothetical protein
MIRNRVPFRIYGYIDLTTLYVLTSKGHCNGRRTSSVLLHLLFLRIARFLWNFWNMTSGLWIINLYNFWHRSHKLFNFVSKVAAVFDDGKQQS